MSRPKRMLKPSQQEELPLSENAIDDSKGLCLALIRADSEEAVIELLQNTGYWDDPGCWRYYGESEGNFSTIGNQQDRSDAALVEKLINSVDARLIGECLKRGIDPRGAAAPKSIREAVAWFFDEGFESSRAGRVGLWGDQKRTQVAKGITLAATGNKPPGNPCFTISDSGEGQTPDLFPETLLSIDKKIKLRIPFVQGKFNMGGTGVLQFCGKHNLQLIVSRRDPSLVKRGSSVESDTQWGFSIVRRERPEGGRRTSVYTYLAPVDADNLSNEGGVLRFKSDKMPIFPERDKPYSREAEWGTLIKLYEYNSPGFRSDILRTSGLLYRAELLLPDVALPIRFHECRKYGGHSGSHDTNLTGISVRLEGDKGTNLEQTPWSFTMTVSGESINGKIFAFKEGASKAYRHNEGIIFVLNGQTHGHFKLDFFRRKKVGLSYLAESLLVILDCSDFSLGAVEDLFMNSRDRLRNCELREEIEHELEDFLRNHPGLKDLRDRRRAEEIQSKLGDDKPLSKMLERLLKKYPVLSSLFLEGPRISDPLKKKSVRAKEKPYIGKKFPSYFMFKGKKTGYQLQKSCHINIRCRIAFETDVVNDYFERILDKGINEIYIKSGNELKRIVTGGFNLNNGIATLNIKLPENSQIGETINYEVRVSDPTQIAPFVNRFIIYVKHPVETRGGKGDRKKPPGSENGIDRDIPGGIKLPKIKRIQEQEWEKRGFDKYTALKVKHAGKENGKEESGDEKDIYDFFVNIDNIFLTFEQKRSKEEPKLIEERFVLGVVLIGMGLLQEDLKKENKKSNETDELEEKEDGDIEKLIDHVTKAVAPVLLPMIDYLGDIKIEDTQLELEADEVE